MQAAETVYEFGSSPDEDDDKNGQPPGPGKSSKKETHQQANQQPPPPQPTSIAGTNLRPNKTSSTSINQKLNTSFSSISDNNPLSHPPDSKNNPSSHQHHLHHHHHHHQNPTGHSSGSSALVGGSISNTSNTSLSSATNSSRGNVSQSDNQSFGVSSQKGLGHQPSSSSSQQQQNPNFDSNVISERVKNLATQIYQELKRIISRCNYDEDILSGLMPLIVRVLESLDLALIENQQLQVELELCKDDNEQLVVMFEKEKAAKRAIDKKLIESEYAYEEERQQYQQKIESLDNIVKMFELKAKNASDQATRFEEKEAERKREYNKLHDRYTELLKSHCDVVERVRHLAGNNEVVSLSSISVAQPMVASSSELMISEPQSLQSSKVKGPRNDDSDYDKATLTRNRDNMLKSWNAETELTLEDASLVVIEDMLGPHGKQHDGSSHNESDRTTSEPEGEHEKESENDSIAYTSMEKEFRKLIQDNKDLLNTKNALNVVKDDLIAEVDRLTNEVSMYEQAVEQLNATKDQMKQKVSALDTELRKTKEELEKAKQKIRENNEEGVPYSQRKRFGRAEMAKVLMERNNYKEKFMELQDAVRYTELVRANKSETEKRSGLWKFFSNLFGAPPREPLAIGPGSGGAGGSQTMLASSRTTSPAVSFHGGGAASGPAVAAVGDAQSASPLLAADVLSPGSAVRGGSIRSVNQRLSSNSDLIVLMDSDLNIDRGRALKDVGRASSADMSGYIHAYGWSLSAASAKSLGSPAIDINYISSSSQKILGGTSSVGAFDLPASVSPDGRAKLSGLQVPIPQYCRPLTGDSLGMKIWTATVIDLSGGYTAASPGSTAKLPVEARESPADPDSSGSIVNISSSTPIKSPGRSALKDLEQEVDQALSEYHQTEELRVQTDRLSPARRPILKTTSDMVLSALPVADDTEELSSCVWICSTQHSRSKITIIDIKTKPNELLDSFYVPTFLYCLKSIPGSKAADLPGIDCTKSSGADQSSKQEPADGQPKAISSLNMIKELIATQKKDVYQLIEVDLDNEHKLRQARKLAVKRKDPDESNSQLELSLEQETQLATRASRSSADVEDDAEISRILDNNVSVGVSTLQKLNDFVAHIQPQEARSAESEPQTPLGVKTPTALEAKPSEGCQDAQYYQPISTSLSTVWMGGKDSVLYIHSAIGQWKDCVACVNLRDSILQMCHFRGRVFVALADGSLCVFFRNCESKQWEFSRYLLIDINLLSEMAADFVDLSEARAEPAEPSRSAKGAPDNDGSDPNSQDPQQGPSKAPQSGPSTPKNKAKSKVAGIRCLEIANKSLWVGYRNRILIIDPITFKLKHTFNVVPQIDNQIRQIISMRDGVFCCLRSDLILRLYSSLRPYQHIQNIDIEPVVTRLISPKTFVISHITAMKVADNTLWIGNAHGIILTIPCQLVPQISEAPMAMRAGEFEESHSGLSIARFVPKCDISNAQISFHGHKDAVKFFIHAHNLMLSGGQGYLDFRLDMDDQLKSISDKSHLILWQLPR